MKIRVNEIPSGGISLSESFDAAPWKLNRQDINFDKPITITAFITREKENLFVDAQINSIVLFTCSRCLKEFEKSLNKSAMLFFQLEGENILDISDDIREEIIVDYPIKMLCSDNCKGLCPSCGRDLNEGQCSCESE